MRRSFRRIHATISRLFGGAFLRFILRLIRVFVQALLIVCHVLV